MEWSGFEVHRSSSRSLLGRLLAAVLILLAAAGLLAHSLLGVAAPIGVGAGGARLAEYASEGRALARAPAASSVTMVLARPVVALEELSYRYLGDHSYTARVPAVAVALCALFAVALVGWRGWGPWGAVVAAVVFGLSPRLAAAAAVPDPEMLAVAGMLMAARSYLGYLDRSEAAAAGSTIFWLLVATLADPSAYGMAVALVLGLVLSAIAKTRWRAAGGQASLSSPLQAVMLRRTGRGYQGFAAVLLGTLLVEAALLRLCPAGFSPAADGARGLHLIPTGARVLLALWAIFLVARVLTRRPHPRDTVLVGLGLSGLFLLLRPAAGTWLTPVAALVPLAVVDLLAGIRWLGRGRRGLSCLAVAAALVVWFVGAVPVFIRTLVSSRADYPAPAESAEILIRMANEATTPRDLGLALPGFPDGPALRHRLDRRVDRVATVAGALARRQKESNLFLLFGEPLAAADSAVVKSMLQDHPAVQVGSLWMVDLRRSDAGIRCYAFTTRPTMCDGLQRFLSFPGDHTTLLTRQPWQELERDLELGVVAAPDHSPAVTLPDAGDRPRLLLFHNFGNLVGDTTAKAAARARLLDGYTPPTVWMDPTPFGRVVGSRWLVGERALSILWECPGLPPSAPDFALRFLLTPIGRQWKPQTSDHAPPQGCRGARGGELREERIAVKFPYHGRFALGMEATRPRGRTRRSTGHTVDLAEVDYSARK